MPSGHELWRAHDQTRHVDDGVDVRRCYCRTLEYEAGPGAWRLLFHVLFDLCFVHMCSLQPSTAVRLTLVQSVPKYIPINDDATEPPLGGAGAGEDVRQSAGQHDNSAADGSVGT